MDPITLAALGLPQLYKGLKGIAQGIEADQLHVRDTTPAAFREALALGRQAATAQLPGAGTQLNHIEAGTNDTLAAALRAGTSGSSVLGLLGVADQNRTRALADLATRTDANQQQQQQKLGGLLGQQAAYQQRDEDTLDRNRAALRESSQKNIYGALDGASQIAGYARGVPGTAPAPAPAPGGAVVPTLPPGFAPELPGYPGVRRARYGVPDYGSDFSAAGAY